MELSTGERCRACGEARMVMDALYGIYACESCGFVSDQAASELGSEFQIGHVIERRGTNIADRDSGANAAKGLMRGQVNRNFYTGVTNWSERHKDETMKKVQRITGQLRVPGDKIDQVKHLLENTLDGDWGSGRWVDVLVAACVYIVIRQSQLPLTIPEVADCVNCDVVELGRMYNRVLLKLRITVPHVDLAIFLDRAVSTFPAVAKKGKDMMRKISRQGNVLLHHAAQWFITTGRRPLPVVAAVLQLVLESNSISVPITDVAAELHAGIWATRLRFKECKNSLVNVAQNLPWGSDVTPKTVLRHLPFILQFLEMKMKLGKGDATQGSGAGTLVSSSKRVSALVNRKSDAQVLNSRLAITLHDSGEENIYRRSQGETVEGRPAKYLKINGKRCSPVEKRLVEVDIQNVEERLTGGDHSADHTPDLKLSLSRANSTEELSGSGASPSERKTSSFSSGPGPSRVLPVAFIASEEARKRRLHKIQLAKIRIGKHRSLLAKKYGIPHMLAATQSPEDGEGSSDSESKLGDSILAPDFEDLRIEKLLLKGASGEELETGYYKTLEAKFLEEEENGNSTKEEATIDMDNDLIQYLHSRCEVDFLTELNKHRLGDDEDDS
ncbi:hypothetical protein R1sor_006088 [Riccia sorocarpa]|uniref:Transcription factor TFIIB cyclin-like domain-containing protein n=1 Tax=Riccia sorocarpa TaxID=122646 RepID=A0ABD3HPD1_9MARC